MIQRKVLGPSKTLPRSNEYIARKFPGNLHCFVGAARVNNDDFIRPFCRLEAFPNVWLFILRNNDNRKAGQWTLRLIRMNHNIYKLVLDHDLFGDRFPVNMTLNVNILERFSFKLFLSRAHADPDF